MAYGYAGKILHIDLTTGASRVEATPKDLRERFLGGRGMAGQYLAPHARRSFDDPLSPVLFFAGPLTGLAAPSSGRVCILAFSPLTGTVGNSNAGGKLGIELKKAGFDGLVVTGRSPKLCGIAIEDGAARIEDASHLSGRSPAETVQRLPAGGASASIGPAGEKGSRFAVIVMDGEFPAGRGGLGLTLGAKNCKYVRVKGTGELRGADPGAMAAVREDILRMTAASPTLTGSHGFKRFGSGALFQVMDDNGLMPTNNFRRAHFGAAEKLNAAAYKKRYNPQSHGCPGCHIKCRSVAPGGLPLPGFESMSHFTALIGNTDLEVTASAHALCLSLGIDPISAASALACHAEITDESLTPERIFSLLAGMGRLQGEGAELGCGSAIYAKSMGRPELSMSVKSLELPSCDPRGAYGMALAYATSPRGGCYLQACPIRHDFMDMPASERLTFAGKDRQIKLAEDANAAVDSLIVCKYVMFGASLTEYARALSAALGRETTREELMASGERTVYCERMINAVRGFSARDDDLPGRFFNESGAEDGQTARPISRPDFLDARSAYYALRGLDENGLPTREKAAELGLAWID